MKGYPVRVSRRWESITLTIMALQVFVVAAYAFIKPHIPGGYLPIVVLLMVLIGVLGTASGLSLLEGARIATNAARVANPEIRLTAYRHWSEKYRLVSYMGYFFMILAVYSSGQGEYVVALLIAECSLTHLVLEHIAHRSSRTMLGFVTPLEASPQAPADAE